MCPSITEENSPTVYHLWLLNSFSCEHMKSMVKISDEIGASLSFFFFFFLNHQFISQPYLLHVLRTWRRELEQQETKPCNAKEPWSTKSARGGQEPEAHFTQTG
jgi:hypothetical protein